MTRVGFPAHRFVLPLIVVGSFLAAAPAAAGGNREALERTAAAHYDAGFRSRARAYHRPTLVAFLLELGVTVAAAIWLLLGPGHPWVRALARAAGPVWLGRVAVLTAAYLGFAVLEFPFRVFFYVHAREAGLRHDPWSGFLLDWTKGLAVGWIQVVAVGLLVLWLFAALPRWGWLWGAGGIGVLAALYIFVAPILVDPLFHRFRPLEDSALASRLLEIAHRGGIAVGEILVADASRRTRAVNAYFTGLGRTKRIVLYDTLVEKLDAEEVSVVLAHEVGHWKHRHVMLGLAGGVLGAAAGLGVLFLLLGRGAESGAWSAVGREDPILALPAYALTVLLLTAAMVPANMVSRRMETQADRASLDLTGDREAFIRSEVRIAHENLSDVLPSAWVEFLFYTHPSNARRILLAEEGP